MISRERIGMIADSIRTSLGLACPYVPEKAVALLNGEIQYITTMDHRIDAAIKKNGADGFIRGEGLIPRRSAAVIKVLNPSPIPYENNIPRGSAARLLIIYMNSHKPYVRERFTLAHELGHLFLHMGYLLEKTKWDSMSNNDFQDSAFFRLSDNYTQEENEDAVDSNLDKLKHSKYRFVNEETYKELLNESVVPDFEKRILDTYSLLEQQEEPSHAR